MYTCEMNLLRLPRLRKADAASVESTVAAFSSDRGARSSTVGFEGMGALESRREKAAGWGGFPLILQPDSAALLFPMPPPRTRRGNFSRVRTRVCRIRNMGNISDAVDGHKREDTIQAMSRQPELTEFCRGIDLIVVVDVGMTMMAMGMHGDDGGRIVKIGRAHV